MVLSEILFIYIIYMVIIKHSDQRVGVFLDVQNLYHSAKNLYDSRVNFEAVVKTVVSGRVLVRSIAYVIHTESGEESAFLDALVGMGIETKSKELQVFSDNAKKADWDVGLAIDMVSLAPKLDVIALVSGDGDFVPALGYLKKFGCQVEVVAFGKTCSQKLQEVADDFVDLCSSKKYLIRPR